VDEETSSLVRALIADAADRGFCIVTVKNADGTWRATAYSSGTFLNDVMGSGANEIAAVEAVFERLKDLRPGWGGWDVGGGGTK
jgi:hypothetical protein